MKEALENFRDLPAEEKEKKAKQWMQAEYAKLLKFSAEKGIQIDKVEQQKSGCFPPLVAVWYVKSKEQPAQKYWVITGLDMPTDITSIENGKSVRQALRHFSMNWQLKAQRLLDGLESGRLEFRDKETQQKFADSLIKNAEYLYQMYESDVFWQGAPEAAKQV